MSPRAWASSPTPVAARRLLPGTEPPACARADADFLDRTDSPAPNRARVLLVAQEILVDACAGSEWSFTLRWLPHEGVRGSCSATEERAMLRGQNRASSRSIVGVWSLRSSLTRRRAPSVDVGSMSLHREPVPRCLGARLQCRDQSRRASGSDRMKLEADRQGHARSRMTGAAVYRLCPHVEGSGSRDDDFSRRDVGRRAALRHLHDGDLVERKRAWQHAVLVGNDERPVFRR
jgi:hypothetical protein